MSLSNLKIPPHQHQRVPGGGSIGHPSSDVRTYLKRCVNRKRRREEKLDPGNAPTKNRYFSTY